MASPSGFYKKRSGYNECREKAVLLRKVSVYIKNKELLHASY